MDIICTKCNQKYDFGILGRCPACQGILQPKYSKEAIKSLANIQAGKGIDRYRQLFPVTTPLPFLGEGNTPLIKSKRVGKDLGLENLYFKNEGCNPSGAFKDRAGALVAALALEAGNKVVLTASSGNAAASISAYSAAAGLKCVVMLEPNNPPAKMRQTLATGASVLQVEGIFSHGPQAISDLILELAKHLNYYPAFVWAPVNPYILEGIKTISYEIRNDLSRPPDVVISPVGGGDMLMAQWRGYVEMMDAGLIDTLPRMIGVQSTKAPPLLRAFESGAEIIDTLPSANSRISGINVPFTGEHALAAVRNSKGTVIGVDDENVMSMQKRIALEEGIWVEPVSAAPVVALSKLLLQGLIKPWEQIVCIMSGAGFKDSGLAQKEAEDVTRNEPIPFDVNVLVEIIRSISAPSPVR